MSSKVELDTAVRGKLAAEKVNSLNDAVLVSIFSQVACPTMCLASARRQVYDGLTLEMLKAEFPTAWEIQ